MKKVKILHINSYFNGSSFYKHLYDEQVRTGTKLDVFVPVSTSYQNNGEEFGEFTKISKNHKKYDRAFFYLKHNKIYRDVIKQYNINDYTITHAHSLFSNGYIAWKLKKKYDLPYVVAVRNTDLNIFFKKMPHLRSVGLQIMKDAEKVIFLSSSYLETIIQKYIPKNLKEEIYIKSLVIPNGVGDYWLKNLGEPKRIARNHCINILYVGVIDNNKNILKSLEAIKLLHKKGYRLNFTIVGRIKDKRMFKKIKSLNFVNYFSPKQQVDLHEIYLQNDLFLMPSIKETFGLVYVEAMSQGLPVIYTRNQGFDKQFKEGEVGYSVDSNSALDISEKILKVLNRYEDLSQSCIKNTMKFNWTDINKNYIQIYQSCGK